jgi:PAS domain S-box-containing protein
MVLRKLSFASLIHPDDLEIIRGAVNRAVERDRRWRITYRMRHNDGGWIWVYETGGGVRDPDSGALAYLDGVVLDVSQFQPCLDAMARNAAFDFN